MAQGDITYLDHAIEELGLGSFNLNTNTVKLALITSAITPATTDADPGWAVARTTDYSTAEVTPGGNYTAGGVDITNTFSQTGGTGTFDASDITFVQNVANPTNARWAILYNDTGIDKKALMFVDLGANFDMTSGDLSFTWDATGILTIA